MGKFGYAANDASDANSKGAWISSRFFVSMYTQKLKENGITGIECENLTAVIFHSEEKAAAAGPSQAVMIVVGAGSVLGLAVLAFAVNWYLKKKRHKESVKTYKIEPKEKDKPTGNWAKPTANQNLE